MWKITEKNTGFLFISELNKHTQIADLYRFQNPCIPELSKSKNEGVTKNLVFQNLSDPSADRWAIFLPGTASTSWRGTTASCSASAPWETCSSRAPRIVTS